VFARPWGPRPLARRVAALAATILFVGSLLPVGAATPLAAPVARASDPEPSSVTVAGSLQSEIGCAGDWDPACAASHLAYDANDTVWQGAWDLPAGNYEYKAALNDSWDVNYGLNAQPGGANIPLNLGSAHTVKFYYSNATHWITDNISSVIATAVGSFQSELGCSGDWDPGCLRSWLQDPDGNGVYTFSTTAIPPGAYEAKVAVNESWDLNYGQGGAQNGPNIGFSVTSPSTTTFEWDSTSHVLSITVASNAPSHDNNVEWDGLRHDSRDTLYRTPGGAVPAGNPVTIRFRTFHNDVTGVKMRLFSVDQNAQQLVAMHIAASDVSCYQASLADQRCDFWQATIPSSHPADNLWYRFIVSDGTSTAYYADDTAALDGGLGATTASPVDNSWALMLSVPGFTAPAWAKNAVIYQIFPDRFRNGRSNNDAKTGDVRYDDPVLALRWGTLPEGYCRNYAGATATTCPWRFDATQTGLEQPRGRDYFGGDLKGVDQELDYLKAAGVNTIYFNPIFDSGSNHGYDTQDYTQIDGYFGTQKDWENLVKHAGQRGMRIILDGVFNHLSSDSPFFDRYHHYATVGACESATSPYRSWFFFQDVTPGTGTCVGSDGTPNAATYTGWFGFDSIPVINKAASNTAVWQYFLTGDGAITTRWIEAGASGWRLDVAGDTSFPPGYWETFREVLKAADPNAIAISETWQKDSTLLRELRGDRFDTTMNYRFRDAVIGFLAPGPFDSKGFADSGNTISASAFLNRLSSIREDYPDAAYYSAMNLLDSHDTARLLWVLTPGADNAAAKEQNAANVAVGKNSVRLASLIQFTNAGAPTVYYGDEVGMTGNDDPDDRRTYPWADLGGHPDTAMLAWYTSLSSLRSSLPVLRDGDFRALLADDADGVAAYGRATTSQAAIVVVNRDGSPHTVTVPLAGYLRDGLAFSTKLALGSGGSTSALSASGSITVTVPAAGALVLATDAVDLNPTAAPVLQLDAEADASLSVSWSSVPGAASYDVWVSPVSGGGYVLATNTPVTGTSFELTGLTNGQAEYVVVTANDAAGNRSAWSNEVSGLPHLAIGWANLQWPPTMSHVISAVDRTDTAYGQVWIDGVTSMPGATPGLRAQLGYGPAGTDPAASPGWMWLDAAFNTDVGNNDEYQASMLPDTTGSFDYVFRYSTTGGRDWIYADLNGPVPSGSLPANPGQLTVTSSGDTTAPDQPTGLHVVDSTPSEINLAWDANAGDPTMYGYEVQRSADGASWDTVGTVTSAAYTDLAVTEGDTWHYRVEAVDLSFNRSTPSASVTGSAELRTVTVTFTATVPSTTDGTGRSVYIAGTLDRLDGGLPPWDPAGVAMTRVDATHWTVTLTGGESTQIEYKYVLGDWNYVEKDSACGEIANRQLTLAYGATGTQAVNDIVLNWRNVSPCGN
jgi:glycosidase